MSPQIGQQTKNAWDFWTGFTKGLAISTIVAILILAFLAVILV